MNDDIIHAATCCPVHRPSKALLAPAAPFRLRALLSVWGARIRFRRELRQKAKDHPYLIDDIGMTMQQVEIEVAKPFWRA